MRKLLFILLTVFVISCSQKEIIFKDNLGNDIKLSALNDKWLIVSYWAPWCHTCLQEIPELNKFYKLHQNKNLVLVGVNYDNYETESLAATLQKTNITFPVLTSDPSTAWNLGAIDAVPTTFILNPKGKVMKKIVGPTTEQALSTTLAELQKIPA